MKKLFYNGKILKFEDKGYKFYDAISIDGDCIVDLYNEIKLGDFDDCECIDLKGKLMLPGFNDSHMHLVNTGLQSYKVDFSNCNSIADMRKQLIEHINENEKSLYGDWILGYGWNEKRFEEGRLPNADDIDDILGEIPFFSPRICGHIALFNSAAALKLGLDENVNDPKGGQFDRKSDGKLSGIARENALFEVFNKIDLPNDKKELKKIIVNMIEELNAKGLTSVQTDDFSHVRNPEVIIEAYQELECEGLLKCRIDEQRLFLNTMDFKIHVGKYNNFKDGEYFKLGPLKLLLDGSLGAKTAALSDNYENSETNGILAFTDSDVERFLEIALENEIEFATHAIGDKAMMQVLNAMKKIQDANDRSFKRSKIVHCQIGSEMVFDRMVKQKVRASIQPIFVSSDYSMVESCVGVNRAKYSYAWKSMSDRGIGLSGSSDAPIESFDPLLGIYAAVTRKDLEGNPKDGWHLEEKLSLGEAVRIYTLGSAEDTGESKTKGNLKSGYKADMVILSENIFDIDCDEIKNVFVEKTYLGGVKVYDKYE